MLDFLRLKWQMNAEYDERHAKGKVFALCTLESVRGNAHVLRANVLVDLFHGIVP